MPLLSLVTALALGASSDTIRLEVGSPRVDGRLYAPHLACVRVRVGDDPTVVTHWTNRLTLGDSAGRRVMRWVTRGTQYPAGQAPVTWQILQTYDAQTLAPYAYHRTSSAGADVRLTFAGRQVRGTRQANASAPVIPVDLTLDRAGFIASASDLVPLAAGLEKGRVMTAPLWGPGMERAELRVFAVTAEKPVQVEGTTITAWEIEERRHADGVLLARWYMTDRSPYMVYGETYAPDGTVRKMSEVDVEAEGACGKTITR
jgi:hypothetical protein